jgi:hypothetical protein
MGYTDRSGAHWGKLDMDENRPADDLDLPQGGDYEYDEAHDLPAAPTGEAAAPRPVNLPPAVNVDDSGDYAYDEAHDFGAR